MALPTTPKPAIQQGWVRAIVFFIVYLVIYLLVSALTGVVWVLKHPGATTTEIINDPSFHRLGLVLSATVSIAVVIVFRLIIDRRSILSMGFPWRGHQRDAWAGFLLGPVLLGTGSLILFFTRNIGWTETNLEMAPLLTGLGLFLITSFSEEMVFRGYILHNLLSSLNKWTALGVTSVLFALVHIGNAHIDPVAILNLLAGGFLLGINYIYTRNLWFSIFFHFSWNFFQGAVLGYEVSGLGSQSIWQMERSGPPLLTGGQFGFEGSFVATILLLAAILFCLQRKWWDQ